MNETSLPLVPVEVDLRDFGFMPLDVLRLRDSDLAALASGDEFKAAVLLWCVAWHQVPAGSLPDDDRLLARYSGAGASWKKVREEALRGFVKCLDGRLYHTIISEKALEAWNAKLSQRERTRKATEAREAKRRAEQKARDDERNVTRDGQRDVQRNDERDESRNVVQGTGTGTGTGTGKEERNPPVPPLAANTTAKDGDSKPEVIDFAPTPAGAACLALRRAGMQRTNPSDPRLSALLDAGATVEELVAIVPECLDKGEPWAYLLTVATNRRQRAAATALTLHRGPMQPQETPGQRAARMRIEAVSPNLVDPRFRRTATTPTEIIDVAPAQLG